MTRARLWLLVAGVGAIIAGLLLLLATPADADPGTDRQVRAYAADAAPVICSVLDDYPTISGVAGVLQGIKTDSGLTDFQSGQVIAIAVQASCPRHVGLLQRFVDTYAPTRGGLTV